MIPSLLYQFLLMQYIVTFLFSYIVYIRLLTTRLLFVLASKSFTFSLI
jgi:hypothetical protein